ncbi:MAG: four helix bundle protein [Bacteroidales bacterium]|nr:four helix bundle protein [Bacteroidales bacterium]
MKIQSYKELIVWQKAMDMVANVYKLTQDLPKEELFALTSQIRRAAISVPSNIAEGYGRQSKKEYLHFLSVANGSVCEIETQLLLCAKIGYLSEESIKETLQTLSEIGKMIFSIRQKIG